MLHAVGLELLFHHVQVKVADMYWGQGLEAVNYLASILGIALPTHVVATNDVLEEVRPLAVYLIYLLRTERMYCT